MSHSTWSIITIIITLIIPPLIFYLIQEVIKSKKIKLAVGVFGLIIIVASVVNMRSSYEKDRKDLIMDRKDLIKKMEKLLIEKIINSIWIEKIIKLTGADYIQTSESFETFVKFYVQNPTRFIEIKNYSEDSIPNNAMVKKLDGYYKLGKDKLKDALNCFEEALRMHPGYYTAKLGKAMVYRRIAFDESKLENEEETLKYLNLAKQIYVELQNSQKEIKINDPTPFIQLAFCYVFIKANYNEAENLLVKALKIENQNGEAFNLLGLVKEHQFWMFKREKLINEAEKSIKMALCFYNHALKHDYIVSKINIERLEQDFSKIDPNEMEEIIKIYLKEKGILQR